jgi:hypothetical protein
VTAFARELRELRVGLGPRLSEDDFVRRVLAECASEPERVLDLAPAATGRWRYGVALAAAACVGLAVAA